MPPARHAKLSLRVAGWIPLCVPHRMPAACDRIAAMPHCQGVHMQVTLYIGNLSEEWQAVEQLRQDLSRHGRLERAFIACNAEGQSKACPAILLHTCNSARRMPREAALLSLLLGACLGMHRTTQLQNFARRTERRARSVRWMMWRRPCARTTPGGPVGACSISSCCAPSMQQSRASRASSRAPSSLPVCPRCCAVPDDTLISALLPEGLCMSGSGNPRCSAALLLC